MVTLLKTVADLRKWRAVQRQLARPVGLVPTMGALHAGHLDLLKRSLAENRAAIVSIFVNPSQFAPHEDLDRYPRTLDSDLEKIRSIAQQYGDRPVTVFTPSVAEMYPAGITLHVGEQRGTFVEVLGYSHQLEGSVRPQFFRGVATVVNKLLNAVQPDKAYFGQKDIQQSVVVRRMVKDLLMPVDIVVSPTAREPSGLAMSSRNEYLAPDVRERAAIVYKALLAARRLYESGTTSTVALTTKVREIIASEPVISAVEYVSINDLDTLADIDDAKANSTISVAVQLPNREGGTTRILDNIVL